MNGFKVDATINDLLTNGLEKFGIKKKIAFQPAVPVRKENQTPTSSTRQCIVEIDDNSNMSVGISLIDATEEKGNLSIKSENDVVKNSVNKTPTIKKNDKPKIVKLATYKNFSNSTSLGENHELNDSTILETPSYAAPDLGIHSELTNIAQHKKAQRTRLSDNFPEFVEESKKEANKWPKLLGERIVAGEATFRGYAVDYGLKFGTELDLTRADKHKKQSNKKMLESHSASRSSRSNSNKNNKSKYKFKNFKNKVNKDWRKMIIRIRTKNGREIGRLNQNICNFLAIPLDLGYISITAEFLSNEFSKRFEYFDTLPMKLKIYLEHQKSFDIFEDLTDGSYNNDSIPYIDGVRENFFKIVQFALGKFNPISSYRVKFERKQIKSGEEEFSSEKKTSKEEKAKVLDSKKGPAQQVTQYAAVDTPKALNVTLRPYQKDALGWMLAREAEDASSLLKKEYSGEKELNPLWEKHKFADDSGEFYVNKYTKLLSLKEPPQAEPCKGGILGDEMGLGKTIMMLSLILAANERMSVKVGKDKCGTLIIVPMSLMKQWYDEIKSKTKEGKGNFGNTGPLKTVMYQGSKDLVDLRGFDIVITTYGRIATEYKKLSAVKKKMKKAEFPLFAYAWNRVILDEGHAIKNPSTNQSKACCHLEADCRFVLTGTPITNSINDLYALFRFLRSQPWSLRVWWDKIINNPYQNGDKSALKRLRTILGDGPILLRRTKDMVDVDGNQIVTLPDCDKEIVYLNFTSEEAEFYNSLYENSLIQFEGFIASSSGGAKVYASIFALLLRLRQACDHPFLVLKRHLSAEKFDDSMSQESFLKNLEKTSLVPNESAIVILGALDAQVSDENNQSVERKMECPVCLDKISNPVITPCSHIFCSPCLLQSLAYFDNNKCPVCREPCTKKDVVPLSTTRNVSTRPKKQVKTFSGEEVKSKEQLLRKFWKPSTKVTYLYKAIMDMIEYNKKQEIEFLKETSSSKMDYDNDVQNKNVDENVENLYDKGDSKSQMKVESKTTSEQHDLMEEEKSDSNSVRRFSRRRRRKRVRYTDFYSDEDIDCALEEESNHQDTKDNISNKKKGENFEVEEKVESVDNGYKPDKAIIFTQWLYFMDILQHVFKQAGIKTLRYDGGMSANQRAAVIDKFNTDKSEQVLIMSLQTGSLGLNLTVANRVFIADSWWNIASELQAQNRVHRLGQSKKVYVKKLVVKESVEMKILKLQDKKAGMAKDVLTTDNDMDENANKLTLDDLAMFFR
jgi:SNF2 family DNA or RNA helicase